MSEQERSRLSVTISDEVHARTRGVVKAISDTGERVSVSQVVEEALRRYLKVLERRHPDAEPVGRLRSW